MNVKLRLFLILLTIGFLGVLSLLLIDMEGIITLLPIPAEEIPTITPALKLLTLVQPTLILAVCVLVGVALASKVGLTSPVAEAAANRGDLVSALKPQIIPGLIGGLIGGVAVVSIAAAFIPFLPPELVPVISAFGRFLPLPTRLLYGGIVEELLLRWGFMTVLVWAAWRFFQKGKDRPRTSLLIGAIVISSVVFGIGHLPVAYMLYPNPTPALVSFVIIGNSTFGMIAGYLY
ncbi:MAG TPA: CPBP family glutamic-type intramembrane protease, partial [Pyrinomonadaceae bacterium]|nr:CPBP family glutamic-type intramembrane protease [Pyrinomonadaceae bacterium]